jgi:hypothetical protein
MAPQPAPSDGVQLEKAARLGHDFARLPAGPAASRHADPPMADGGSARLPAGPAASRHTGPPMADGGGARLPAGPAASRHADPPKAGGGGSPLPSLVRSKMERALGTDLSRVRVHQGEEAESVGALAYTRGTDLHFQRGSYDPTSAPGQRLLGHELAHVVQQAQGRVASPAGAGAPINDDPRLEAEAEAAGARAASGAAPVAGAGTPS